MNKKFGYMIVAAAAAVLAWAGGVWAAADGTYSTVRDMTLEECIGLALENNLDYQIERLTRQIADWDVDAAKGGYDPVLGFSAKRSSDKTLGESAGLADGVFDLVESKTDSDSYTASLSGSTALAGLSYELSGRMGDSSGNRGANPFDTTTGSAGITLTQPLLKGFKTDGTRYRVATARKQSEEARIQLEEQIQNILFKVESAWYTLIQARENIAVQEEAVRLAEQLQADTKQKVLIGSMSRLDEKQAESQAASARADLSSARQSYVEAQNKLKALVFADHRTARLMELKTQGDLSAEPQAIDVPAVGDEALENRPDLRKARLALERQGLTVDYNRNQTLPSLDLVGGYGVIASDESSYGDAFDRMDSADEPFWTVGVTLSIPLGNRSARVQHKQSLATADKMKLQLRQLEEDALVEVENASAAIQTGWERITATRDAREYAEEALAAEQQKLDNGKSTSFVVLQLQKDLTSARKSEIAALADYNQQLSTLSLAIGSMANRHGVELAGE